jgi:hypothetical protein
MVHLSVSGGIDVFIALECLGVMTNDIHIVHITTMSSVAITCERLVQCCVQIFFRKTVNILVSNKFSPGTSSRHRVCRCCVIVSTADCICAFNSRLAWLLKCDLNTVLATYM